MNRRQVEAIQQRHAPFRLVDECDCDDHAEILEAFYSRNEPLPDNFVFTDDWIGCERTVAQTICRHCCVGLWGQTEECVDNHGKPRHEGDARIECWPCDARQLADDTLNKWDAAIAERANRVDWERGP